MLAVLSILLLIVSAINIHNYLTIVKNADETINFIFENDGYNTNFFPKKPDKNDFSPELPYEIRYFSVIVDKNQNIMNVNMERIAAINETNAIEYTKIVINKSKNKGFLSHYRYHKEIINDKIVYVFLDCTNSLNTFYKFLSSSIIISVIGVLAFLVVVIIFSSIVIHPVKESYLKQQQFITNASHELKTPLTIINASCEIIEYEQNNEWTKTIKTQVARLTDLTNKLVYLSRMGEKSSTRVKSDFSLNEVINEVIEPYVLIFKSNNWNLEMNIEENLTLFGDIGMIKEMFTLLFDNIVKYCNGDGLIELTVQKYHKNIIIILKNSCEEIKKGNLNILFERFFRNDTSRNSEMGGSGIGLSIVKAIVDAHKGKIKAESTDGKSLMFTIIL